MGDHKHKKKWTPSQRKALADCVKQYDKSNVGIKKREWKVIQDKFELATGIKRSASSLRNKSFLFFKQSSPTYRSKKQNKPLRKDARKRLDEIKDRGDQEMNALDEVYDMMLELGLASFDVDELLGTASVKPIDETTDFEINITENELNDFIDNMIV